MSAPPYAIGSDVWPGTAKLVEEMGEVQQQLGKLLGAGGDRHWDGDLRPRLIEELGDLLAAARFFAFHNFTKGEYAAILTREMDKFAAFEGWHKDPKPPGEE